MYFQEKQPAINRFGSVNVSLEIYHNGHQISTGYIVRRNNNFFSSGKTLSGGAVLVVVPVNSTYIISSNNLKGQNYYSVSKTINTNVIKPYYIRLNLVSPGKISASSKINNSFVVINVSSTGYYNDLSYCVNWGVNIVYVTSSDKLSKRYFPSYVNCYDTHKSLSNNNYSVILKYKKWSDSKPAQIKVLFFDKVFTNNTILYKNIGGKDLPYNLDINNI